MKNWCRWLPWAFVEWYALRTMQRLPVYTKHVTYTVVNPFHGVMVIVPEERRGAQ